MKKLIENGNKGFQTRQGQKLKVDVNGDFITICRNIKSERATIHTNLVVALGIADVIFLVTVVVKPDGVSSGDILSFALFFE